MSSGRVTEIVGVFVAVAMRRVLRSCHGDCWCVCSSSNATCPPVMSRILLVCLKQYQSSVSSGRVTEIVSVFVAVSIQRVLRSCHGDC